jgi:predicted adenine nucleotide alpha hydrolase (AANH) superfamily ATPase
VKLLMHTCCGPCSIYPVQVLRDDRCDVMGFFYRSNIHPFTECMRREETLKNYAESIALKLIYQEGYPMEAFLRNVAFRESERCTYCYHDRLTTTAAFAKKGKFDAFTTTLLYSRFQKHDQIRSIGEAVGKSAGVPFFYRDFREGWKTGIEESRRLGMYRQPYCGCIFSEKERYHRQSRKNTPRSGGSTGASTP